MPGTALNITEDNQSPFPHKAYIAVAKRDDKQKRKWQRDRKIDCLLMFNVMSVPLSEFTLFSVDVFQINRALVPNQGSI